MNSFFLSFLIKFETIDARTENAYVRGLFSVTLAIDEKERERARERAFGLVKVIGDHVNHCGEMLGNADYRWMRFETPYIHR